MKNEINLQGPYACAWPAADPHGRPRPLPCPDHVHKPLPRAKHQATTGPRHCWNDRYAGLDVASVTICDRLGRDGQVVCYIVRAHVRFLFYIKTCAFSINHRC